MALPSDQLRNLIESAFREDIGTGDVSTLSSIPPDAMGKAILRIKQEGILAGVEVAREIFLFKDPATEFRQLKEDGEAMRPGETAFEVSARIHTILQCERLVLNCMQRMSGIATLTHVYVSSLKGFKTKILDTRKTTPNFRLLEKEAVRIGGGVNHRFGLYDMIMLKDNHIDYSGGIEPAVTKAWEYVQSSGRDLKIEVETRTIEEVRQAVGTGKVDRIMLDNFSPDTIRQALRLIDGQIETEASGGINLDNIVEYAKTGVDYISVGALIHQARSIDLSLKALIVEE